MSRRSTNTNKYIKTNPEKNVKSSGFIGSIMTTRNIDADVMANQRLYDLEKMYMIESYTNPDLAEKLDLNPLAVKKTIKIFDIIIKYLRSISSELVTTASYLSPSSMGDFFKMIKSISLQADQIIEQIQKMSTDKELLPQASMQLLRSVADEYQQVVNSIKNNVDQRIHIFDNFPDSIKQYVDTTFTKLVKIYEDIDNLYDSYLTNVINNNQQAQPATSEQYIQNGTNPSNNYQEFYSESDDGDNTVSSMDSENSGMPLRPTIIDPRNRFNDHGSLSNSAFLPVQTDIGTVHDPNMFTELSNIRSSDDYDDELMNQLAEIRDRVRSQLSDIQRDRIQQDLLYEIPRSHRNRDLRQRFEEVTNNRPFEHIPESQPNPPRPPTQNTQLLDINISTLGQEIESINAELTELRNLSYAKTNEGHVIVELIQNINTLLTEHDLTHDERTHLNDEINALDDELNTIRSVKEHIEETIADLATTGNDKIRRYRLLRGQRDNNPFFFEQPDLNTESTENETTTNTPANIPAPQPIPTPRPGFALQPIPATSVAEPKDTQNYKDAIDEVEKEESSTLHDIHEERERLIRAVRDSKDEDITHLRRSLLLQNIVAESKLRDQKRISRSLHNVATTGNDYIDNLHKYIETRDNIIMNLHKDIETRDNIIMNLQSSSQIPPNQLDQIIEHDVSEAIDQMITLIEHRSNIHETLEHIHKHDKKTHTSTDVSELKSQEKEITKEVKLLSDVLHISPPPAFDSDTFMKRLTERHQPGERKMSEAAEDYLKQQEQRYKKLYEEQGEDDPMFNRATEEDDALNTLEELSEGHAHKESIYKAIDEMAQEEGAISENEKQLLPDILQLDKNNLLKLIVGVIGIDKKLLKNESRKSLLSILGIYYTKRSKIYEYSQGNAYLNILEAVPAFDKRKY